MKRSLIAFALALVLSFLSMGALGGLLYYACYPLFAPFYGDLNGWRGDWVWPATIGAGMLWSLSFLVAGWVGVRWLGGARAVFRNSVYCLVLWLGAALSWALMLLTSYKPA